MITDGRSVRLDKKTVETKQRHCAESKQQSHNEQKHNVKTTHVGLLAANHLSINQSINSLLDAIR